MYFLYFPQYFHFKIKYEATITQPAWPCGSESRWAIKWEKVWTGNIWGLHIVTPCSFPNRGNSYGALIKPANKPMWVPLFSPLSIHTNEQHKNAGWAKKKKLQPSRNDFRWLFGVNHSGTPLVYPSVWCGLLHCLLCLIHKQKAEKGAPRPPEAEPEEQEEHQGQWWDWPQPGGLGQRTPDLQHASSRFAGH